MNIRSLLTAVLGSVVLGLLSLALLPAASNATFPGRSGPILFSQSDEMMKAIDPSGGTARVLARGRNFGGSPVSSSDGRRFTYIGGTYPRIAVFTKRFANHDRDQKGRRLFSRKAFGTHGFWIHELSVSPGRGRIYFSAFSEDRAQAKGNFGIEIYSIRSDGSGLRQLTKNRFMDEDPTVSPDGRWIAFARRRPGHDAEIYRMRTDGTGVRRLTRGSGWKRNPEFSPDGRRIVFNGQVPRPGLDRWDSSEIFTISSRDGSNRTRVTRNRTSDQYPVFSPSGREIAFVSWLDSQDTIVVRNLEDGSRRKIFQPGADKPGEEVEFLDWAPRP